MIEKHKTLDFRTILYLNILLMLFLIFSGKQQVLMLSFLVAILTMLDIREFALTAKLIVGFVLLFVAHYGLDAIYRTIWNSSFILLLEIFIFLAQRIYPFIVLGIVLKKGSGYFHNMLIDSMERLEYPLAHAIPETTSNVLLPLCVIGLLFFTDWRMGLAVLLPATLTLAFYLPMYIGIMNEFANTYYKKLENMDGRVIEYIRGNKEIKIFGERKKPFQNMKNP